MIGVEVKDGYVTKRSEGRYSIAIHIEIYIVSHCHANWDNCRNRV